MQIIKDIKDLSVSLPVIATPQYLSCNGSIDFGYFFEQGMVLPYYIKKILIFRYIVFPTGVIGKYDKNEEQIFLENILEHLRKKPGIDFILMQHATALFNTYPKGASACHFGTYSLNLTKTEEELFAGLHPKHRNVIKKAKNDGIIISEGSDNFNDCVLLVQETLKRQGLSYPSIGYFQQLKKNLGENLDFWIARDESMIHGSAIILWSKGHNSYYLFGGSSGKHHNGALNLLQWEVIRLMKSRSVYTHDFVGARLNPAKGSKYEGIQRFKERFGGDLKEGYLWKFPIRKIKYRLYINALKIKCILKRIEYTGDVIDQEYKRLGLRY